MDIPIEIFMLGIGVSIALALFGFIRNPQIPAMLVFGGMFFLIFAIATDNIIMDYFNTQSETGEILATNTTVFSYNQAGGVTNFTLRFDSVASFAFTEYATSPTSMLVGDTIQCISYELIRVGNAIPSTNVQFGIMGATENFIQFFGNVSANSISSSAFTYYTVCVPEGQEHLIANQDRIGIKYKSGNSTHFMRSRENTANPFDGTESVRSSMITTAWAQSSTRDTNAKFWDYALTFDTVTTNTISEQQYAFTEMPKVLFALFGVIMMLCGALMMGRGN